MNQLLKLFSATALSLAAASAIASPRMLITHNRTDVESKAFVAGTIPSRHPAKANSDTRVLWAEVKMACFGHVVGGKCDALIKMKSNTASPVVLGWVKVDIDSGDITPKQLSANGYTLTVNGPGETTLTTD